MKKNLSKLLLISLLALGSTACGNKESAILEDPEVTIPDLEGEMEQLSPEQSKEFLSKTADDFLSKFNPKDQEELIELCSYFEKRYGDLDIPENWYLDWEETDDSGNPRALLSGLKNAFMGASPSRAASAIYTYVLDVDWEKFKGIYKPSGYDWEYIGESDDIIFQFNDSQGRPCEVKAVASSKTSDGKIKWADVYEEYYYDYVTGEYYEYIERDENTVRFKIPKEITLTVKNNSTTLVSSKITSDIDVNGHKININTNISAANVNIDVNLDGTDTRVTQNSTFTVSGETLLQTMATVNGSKLCDFDNYSQLYEDFDAEEDLVKLLKNGTAYVDIMGKVRIDGGGTYTQALYEAFNNDFDNWEYSSTAEAERAVQNAINTIKNNIKGVVRYNNTQTVQASLTWKSYFREYGWGDYWSYSIEPLIYFEDGTTYAFEKYIQDGFESVEGVWRDLQKSYEKVWNSISLRR